MTPLGQMSLVADETALLGAYFEGQAYFERGFEEAVFSRDGHPVLEQASLWLAAYFRGAEADLPPLAPKGSPFQERIWHVLLAIPYGQSMTYGQIANQIQCPSAQAVGGAVGRNPLSLFIPCHRVLGAKGQLTGYAGGLERKIWLLEHEKRTKTSPPKIEK